MVDGDSCDDEIVISHKQSGDNMKDEAQLL